MGLLMFIFNFRLKHVDLPVNITKTPSCSLGKKQRLINIQISAAVQDATFKKDGNNIAYLLPSQYAVVENGNNYIKQ